MEEQIVSFETSTLAKEKGYCESCKNWYNFSGLLIKNSNTSEYPSNNKKFPSYSAPTQSLLQKWLREKHNYLVTVLPFVTVGLFEQTSKTVYYNYVIFTLTQNGYEYEECNSKDHETYEAALEQGLLEALKLIKNE